MTWLWGAYLLLEILGLIFSWLSIPLFVMRLGTLWVIFKNRRSFSPPAQQENVRAQSKILALQTQINPHFLYNTLEGIRSEALLSGAGNAARMSELLGKFFRYNISRLDQLVTMGDEIRNLRNYFRIQEFRFEDRIRMEILYDGDKEAIKRCATPKLLLQPILENAILHGLEPLTRPGLVTIRFMLYDNCLMVVVSDDGQGMAPKQLDDLNARMDAPIFESAGIGMENVNKRLRLLFGPPYGLRFYSRPGLGTDVELILPRTEGGIR